MTTAISASKARTPTVAVESRALVWLYGIVPACLLVMLADLAFFRGRAREAMPKTTETLFLFTALFNFPHIVLSYLAYLDRAYLRTYAKPLGLGMLAVFVATLAGFLSVGATGVFALFVIATNVHIFQQQARLLGEHLRERTRLVRAFGIATQILGGVIMWGVADRSFLSLEARRFVFLGSFTVLAVCVVLALRIAPLTTSIVGRRFLAATLSLSFGIVLAYGLGYPLLAIVMTRVIHDGSAVYLSAVHDTNRHEEGDDNLLYRGIALLRMPPAISGPAIAIALAFLAEHGVPTTLGIWLVYFASALHYVLEAVVWRPGMPHRERASFR